MTDASIIAEGMPDIVKLTIVGIAMDPPKINPAAVEPTFAQVLDMLVGLGIAVAVSAGELRTYHLTGLGAEVYDIVKSQRQCDATVAANDLDEPPPAAA